MDARRPAEWTLSLSGEIAEGRINEVIPPTMLFNI
jgi:hypothetical protein